MNLNNFSTGITTWPDIPATLYPGTSGVAEVRSLQLGDVQLRLVVYSANYVADHWCHKGHIVFVVAGSFVIEHQDGLSYAPPVGASYYVADNEGPPHQIISHKGATTFIVD